MHVPKQSKPSVRGSHRGPWRGIDPRQLGVLPLNGEEEYEVAESVESEESTESAESEGSGG